MSRPQGKIRNLDADDGQFDAMYEALEDILRQIGKDISALDGQIKETGRRIRTVKEGAISAEKMLRTFHTFVKNLDGWSPEHQREILHLIFSRIELLPEPRPDGGSGIVLPLEGSGSPPGKDDSHAEDYVPNPIGGKAPSREMKPKAQAVHANRLGLCYVQQLFHLRPVEPKPPLPR